jgi:AAA+ ATPase superfamily predicted ATPase
LAHSARLRQKNIIFATEIKSLSRLKNHSDMIIGRKKEQAILQKAYNSEYSEFVAVYGRRRIGKTFLVREFFNYKFTFYHTGVSKEKTRIQLKSFQSSLKKQGLKDAPTPKNWLDAFDMLAELIEKSSDKKKVIFIDEMPWIDAPRSSFLPAFEHFWNGWASARKDVLLIICGSATSWIMNKVIHNHGGLHNRVTYNIPLEPFTLNECEQYAKNLKLEMSRRQLLECYMILGGVPYYWSKLQSDISLAQNVDELFFSRHGALKDEFKELYASLFSNPEPYMNIITALGQNKTGLTREDIINHCKINDSGKLTKYLENLESCGFIRKYFSIGKKTKDSIYQLIDNYTLFYFKFIRDNRVTDKHQWSKNIDTPLYNTWCGLSFEKVCLQHSDQIKEKLGISGVISSEYSWHTEGTPEYPGAQIDLLIDRNDDVINLCEMKFTKAPFRIDKEYDLALQRKREIFKRKTKTQKAIHITMVTSSGLEDNSFAQDIQSQVTADDLFKE